MTSPSSQRTDFTLDVTGRYVCNGLHEANRSTDRSVDPDAKPFDYIVVGGGSFGSVFASHILNLDHTRSHRILVLEAGPFLFPEHVQNLPPPLDTNEFGECLGIQTAQNPGTASSPDLPFVWEEGRFSGAGGPLTSSIPKSPARRGQQQCGAI
jgi:hypothetical protein